MRYIQVLVTVMSVAFVAVGCGQQQQDNIGSVPSVVKMKAEQVEAQQLLNQIFRMQQTYHAANRQYASNLNDIGVVIPTTARYSYSVTSTGSSWSCSATANLDLDATIDKWVVNQSGGVTGATNDATS